MSTRLECQVLKDHFGNIVSIQITLLSTVPNNSPPSLIDFWIFCRTPPPHFLFRTPLINFTAFVLQIFQRFLKRSVLFAKL